MRFQDFLRYIQRGCAAIRIGYMKNQASRMEDSIIAELC
jgi:hypothetical protein